MKDSKYRILFVEDDKLDQMAFERFVKEQELPYDCTMAGSVSEAQSILASEMFDVIVSDYSLGDGTAFDILDSAKNIPTILVTGAGDEEIATQAWRAGAYDYMIKDGERNYLKTVPITIENAIEHKVMGSRLRLLSHAILSADDSVYITDLEDKITFVNKAFCDTYGYTEEEIIGKDCNILWKENPPSINTENVYQAISGWEVGFYHRRKDGSIFPVSFSRSDVKDESGNEVALVVISRDISERMQIENELRISNRDLQKQNRLKKELAIAVCHQLSEAVGDVKGTILDAMSHNEINTKQKALELVDKGIDRINDIISDFLDVSRIDSSNVSEAVAAKGQS